MDQANVEDLLSGIGDLTKAVNRIGNLMEEDDQQEEFMETLFGTLIETYKAFHKNVMDVVNEQDQFKKAKLLRALAAVYEDAEARAIEKIKEMGGEIEIDESINNEAEANE